MSGFIEGVGRDQVTLFPERLEDWIGEDRLVRMSRLSAFATENETVAHRT